MKTINAIDTIKIRKDFPILNRQINGKPLVYLDNAATSQKPKQVIKSLVEYYEQHNANVHRGVHTLAEESTMMLEMARRKVAKFLGTDNPDNIIFTRNTTESINLVSFAWGLKNIKLGDAIVLSRMEHHSNLVPWQQVAEKTGAELRWIDITPNGELDWDCLENHFKDGKVKLLTLMHVSNVLGTINPVKEAIALAHKNGATALIDGAQSTPHLPINVTDLDADFYTVSGHKMLAPTGIGVLYGKKKLLDAMDPFLTGGSMIGCVNWDHSSWNETPYKFEAGTPNIADSVGMGAAVDYLTDLGMDKVAEHEVELTAYALEQLQKVTGLTVYGPLEVSKRIGAVSFSLGDIHPHDVAQILDSEGIAIRAGHHCCGPLHEILGVMATNRASFYIYNTIDEIDQLVEGLNKVKKVFGYDG